MSGAPKDTAQESELLGSDILTPERFEALRLLVLEKDRAALLVELGDRHESDIAEIITVLQPDLRRSLIELLGADLPAEVFAELDDNIRDEAVDAVDTDTLVATVQSLDSDDAVFVLEDMDEAERDEVLQLIPHPERLVLQRSLDFPEDSAGRLMQSEFISVPPFWTVGQTIDYLRETADLPDDFLEIYITDPTHKPIGVVHLAEVLRAQRSSAMENLLHEDFYIIQAETDREEVALLFERYNLVTAPVVDEDQRLIGVITADDVFEVIAEEAGEDILRLGGVGDEAVTDTVFETARGRLSWLFLNLLTAIAASLVIGLFDASIEKMVALAVLMPIVASMGGNAGTQTVTVAVRAIAMQEFSTQSAARFALREVLVGAVNGVLFAIIAAVLSYIWFADLSISLILGGAMIINLLIAGITGTMVPLSLVRFGVDPAVASSVFITTITDVVGFFVFLGLAAVFLL